jgi:hypothetical protein
MKTGNRHQFALIEADQRRIDHVFDRHDDRRGQFLPRQASDLPQVGRRRAGQDRLDADPIVAEFVLQRMTEGKDIGLGGAVDTVERLRRDANGGADVDDCARTTLDECRCRGVSQSRESDGIECNHLFHFLDVGIKQRRDRGDTCVVDEHCDTRIFLQLCFHFREIYLVVEVRHDRGDVASACTREARSERFEGRLAAAYENEIVATLCETVCIDSSNAPGATRYQSSAFLW